MTRPMFWGPTARMMMVMPIGMSMPPPSPCRHAEDHQLRQVLRNAARHRCEREERDGDEIQTLGAKTITRPAGHRDHGTLREHVAGDDPRDVCIGAGLEIDLQCRDRDVDDGRVEDRHDRAEQHHAERDPLVVEASRSLAVATPLSPGGSDRAVPRRRGGPEPQSCATSLMCAGSGESTIMPIS